MLKKVLFSSMTLLTSVLVYGQTGNTVSLNDVEFSLDTLFHAEVGPGTTQTSLRLMSTEGTKQLRVFYLTIDLTNPVIDIEAIVGNDKLSGGQTVSGMASSHSTETKDYYVGINTDFFVTSGNATNGVSMVGSPVRSSIAGGEIYRTAGASTAWPTFFVDQNGDPNIGAVSFESGTATDGNKTVKFSVVNTDAANDAVSLYTPTFYGVINQPGLNGNCAEVIAKPVTEGDFVQVGKPLVLEITSDVTTTGNREIPEGEFAIVGRGSAIDFVNSLEIGDQVTLTASATVDGVAVYPTDLTTGNPWILRAGERLESESDRGDASSQQPRSSVGYNSDKSKMVMMVIDGRSGISAGVRTKELADMMKYTGMTDAINVDGGGSSTLYTEALGVRNNTSDGHERAVASGLFAVANAPQDVNITEIRFVDWAMECPKYGIYTPVFYGYNQYGIVVSTNLEGVTISCDPKLGEITNEGKTFYATGEGTYALTATYNGMTASIPVTVSETDSENVSLRLSNVLIDNKREYPVEVNALVKEDLMPLNPIALNWSSDNTEVAEIGETTGILKGKANGTATVTGHIGDFTGTMNVTVEIPEADYMPVYRNFPAEDEWTLKQLGGTGLAISELDNGFKVNYTGNGSSRGAYISMESAVKVWSLPESFRIKVNPGNATVKSITMAAVDALGNVVSPWEIATEELPQNTESTLTASLSDWCDTEDIGIYPITINSIRLNMGASAKGEEFEIQIPAFEACYTKQGGITNAVAENQTVKVYPNPVKAGESVSIAVEGQATVSIYSLNGAKVAELNCNGEASIPTDGMNGMYIIKVTSDNSVKIAKLMVR